MIIDRVTLTGADNKTTYRDLTVFQEVYPFVEWGILFSQSKAGEQRYPSKDHIDKEFLTGDLNLSAHFCGWWAKEVLEKQNFDLIKTLAPQFKRIQINYNFKNSTGWNLHELIDFMKTYPDKSIILQYNQSNAQTLNSILDISLPSNIHFLYDASGGRGTEIKTIPKPLGYSYTGYAGGLNPDNVESICNNITSDEDNSIVWIDMESGIRRNNEFDLGMINSVLKSVTKYIK